MSAPVVFAAMTTWLIASAGPVAAAVPPSTTQSAASLEERAFAAVEGERWCEAMRLFERVHALAPSVDLLANAAMAAEYGKDLRGAVMLYERALSSSGLPAARKLELQRKRTAISGRLQRGEASTSCPVLASDVPEQSPPTAVVDAAGDGASTSPPPGSTAVPWTLALDGGGALALLVGGGALGVGIIPWFAHASAAERIRAAEQAQADASSLQVEQAEARASWETWGSPTAICGGVLAGAGAVALGVGIALGVAGAE